MDRIWISDNISDKFGHVGKLLALDGTDLEVTTDRADLKIDRCPQYRSESFEKPKRKFTEEYVMPKRQS